MVMVLINWLYIAVTSFITGYGILGLFARLSNYKIRHTISYFLVGLTVVTVYAQIYSLFSGVGVAANLLLLILCCVIVFLYRESLQVFWLEAINSIRGNKWYIPALFFLILLFAYGTSRGYMHFDTGLYHAQSIRWIEEYGVVPGLANIQARFGYNSAAFVLTALYSMKDILGQSLHTTAGYFALLSSVLTLDLFKTFVGKRMKPADFARIGMVFYLSVIFSQMVSPASDYYAQLLLFIVLILWLDEDDYQKETGAQNAAPYSLLCILIVLAVTIKFSVAVLLLLVIKPAVMLIKEKQYKNISIYLLSGFLTALPFFIRNVLISGWLVYPFAGIDLFSVDWKVPKGQVQYDATEIGVYGKGITDVTKWDTPFSQWCPAWFVGLKPLEKLLVIMTVAALVVGAVYLLYLLIAECKSVKRKSRVSAGCKPIWNTAFDFALVFAVLSVSALFWFFQAPLVRYGYAYITALPLITFGYFICRMAETEKVRRLGRYPHIIFCIVLAGFFLTRVKGFADDILRTWKEPYYVAQMDYIDGEATTRIVDGVMFYVPTENGQIGYNKFPSSLLVQPIELRGERIEDGFRQITE